MLQVYVSCNPTKTLAQDAMLLCGPVSSKTRGMPFRPVKVRLLLFSGRKTVFNSRTPNRSHLIPNEKITDTTLFSILYSAQDNKNIGLRKIQRQELGTNTLSATALHYDFVAVRSLFIMSCFSRGFLSWRSL